MTLAVWQKDSEHFQWNSYSIFVKDSDCKGEQPELPVLLLIHGFPTASIDWLPMWGELSSQFRCITFDLLGFGLSDKPVNRPIKIADQAAICRELLTSKGIDKSHIFCHDYGVSVAQELLASSKENKPQSQFSILSCIYLNGGLFHGVHRPRLIQKLLMSPLGPFVARFTSYKKFATTMNEICTQLIPAPELKMYWELLICNNGRAVLPTLIRYMDERRVFLNRWGGVTDNPPCPSLLINGVDDPISGEHLAMAYEKRVKHPRVVRLDSTGHYPHVESPRKVMVAANTFWRDIVL